MINMHNGIMVDGFNWLICHWLAVVPLINHQYVALYNCPAICHGLPQWGPWGDFDRLDLTTKLVDKGAITHYIPMYVCILVGGFNHLEKIWKSMGQIIPYMKWKTKMFETTNHIYIYSIYTVGGVGSPIGRHSGSLNLRKNSVLLR